MWPSHPMGSHSAALPLAAWNGRPRADRCSILHTRPTRQMITQLLKAGVSAHGVDSEGNTLAHIAVQKHSMFLLEKAIEMGVDLNKQNNMNLSPLHFAAMQGKDKDLMLMLVDKGANKELKTEFDESAYDLALENELLQKEKVNVQFLRMD